MVMVMVIDLESIKRKKKIKSFDLAIPLILIAIVALFIYYNNISLPNIFGSNKMNVVVIGDLKGTAPELYKRFQEQAILYRITGYDTNLDDDIVAYSPKVLDRADLIVLSGKSTLDVKAAKNIRKAVDSGKNLLVLMNAGTVSPDDPYYSPWNDELEKILPVKLETFNASKALHTFKMKDVKEAYIHIIDQNINPLVKGYGLQPKLDLKKYIKDDNKEIKVYKAYPDGNIILYLKLVYYNGTVDEMPILVEKQTTLGGKAIYLGMDIGYIKEAAKKLVLYAAGKSD